MSNKVKFGMFGLLVPGVLSGIICGIVNVEAASYKKITKEERLLQSKKDVEMMRSRPDKESEVLISFDLFLDKEQIKHLNGI